jgi:hypothetical protein
VERQRKDEDKAGNRKLTECYFAELWIKRSMLFEWSFPLRRAQKGDTRRSQVDASHAGQAVTVPEDCSQSILRVASESLCRAS